MTFIAPGIAIHSPAGSFDNLVPKPKSAIVESKAPSIIDEINGELRTINESIANAREGMNDLEYPDSVRAHFQRLYEQFQTARSNLLQIKAEWHAKSAATATAQFPDTWNADNTETLRQLFAEGKTLVTIAQATGVTINAVRHKIRRLKLTRRQEIVDKTWNQENVALLRRLYCEEGKNTKAIGEIMGLSASAVRTKKRHLQLTRTAAQNAAFTTSNQG